MFLIDRIITGVLASALTVGASLFIFTTGRSVSLPFAASSASIPAIGVLALYYGLNQKKN